MNVYLRQERILAIFPAAMLSDSGADESVWRSVRIVAHGIPLDDAKAYILADNQELHISNVNCRTLRQRWKQRIM